MEVKYTVCLIILAIASRDVTSTTTTKDVRTGVLLPEKFINGVIDIVQSHKNKPSQQTQPNPPYQQYPQQWNSQNANFQNGFNAQSQYQGQFNAQNQFNYQNGYNQQNFPQNGNFQGFAGNQGFTTQGQNQQYQVVYQNVPNQLNHGSQYASGSGQYIGTSQAPSQPNGGHYQGGSGQYHGTTGSYQGSSGQHYQGTSGTGQYQSTNGQFQGSGIDGSGQMNGQGFMVSNGQSGQGPTCVCQAWTKPQADVMNDPIPEKVEKDVMQSRML
ncbi:unnamed protein product [Pieris macdunnoughi]|uniref:Uncharacterized protein n=1 Tax=Pieris macdunnoughi TaxID=345717 RepID=A0A821TFT5_9NEOP|nr:unnamed protein product [Pieris macdunnoughi]